MDSIGAAIPEKVRGTTKGLLLNLLFDLPLTIPQADDFGVATPDHYRALKMAMEAGVKEMKLRKFALKLDKMLGDGKAITTLVNHYAPGTGIEYHTVWDTLRELQE